MLMRQCLLAMLMLMLVILMLIRMLLNLSTRYADTDLCMRIMSLCCMLWSNLRKFAFNFANLSFRDTLIQNKTFYFRLAVNRCLFILK